jgi:arylformamidase
MRLLDVSPLVSPRIGVWPGDVPYAREASAAIADGANIDLSAIRTTLHLGAHADSPSHTVAGGAGIHAVALDAYYGPCEVMRIDVARNARIRPEDLPRAPRAPRVLFATGTFPDPDAFNTDFASLGAPLVAWLADRGVVLAGLDTPSVDLFDDKRLESHVALASRGMAHLEGLVLAHVPPGLYTLAAFPLKLEGADAAPVRAVLVDERAE